jgi:hypothetical protein
MDITRGIVLTLTIDECNVLRKGLTKLTIEEAMGTLMSLDGQVQEQLKPKEEKPDGTENEINK